MRLAAPAQASWRRAKRWGHRPGVPLLDIGGGTGNFARPLTEAGFQLTLADYSPAMVRRAAAKLDGTFVVAPLYHYQPAAETVQALRDAGFSRVEQRAIHYTDADDGSFQALKHHPEFLLDDERILNTAVLMRVPEVERLKATETIRRDYASGRLREVMARFEPLVREYGNGFLFAAH